MKSKTPEVFNSKFWNLSRERRVNILCKHIGKMNNGIMRDISNLIECDTDSKLVLMATDGLVEELSEIIVSLIADFNEKADDIFIHRLELTAADFENFTTSITPVVSFINKEE